MLFACLVGIFQHAPDASHEFRGILITIEVIAWGGKLWDAYWLGNPIFPVGAFFGLALIGFVVQCVNEGSVIFSGTKDKKENKHA